MSLPQDLRYTASHEWVRQEQDGALTVGLTNHAQEALGDVIFLELPEIGQACRQDDVCGVIESVKAASDIYSPVSGKVVAVNTAAVDEPGKVNEQPYETWLFRIQPADTGELQTLLSPQDYAQTAEN